MTTLPKDYLEARKFVRKWEGGYVNNPKDPGGATDKGITQSVYDSYRRGKGLPVKTVRGITDEEADEIYYRYWLNAHCDSCEWPLNLSVFDTSINFGAGRAIEFLQKAVGVPADKKVGPNTLRAIKAANPKVAADKVCDLRVAYRYARVKKAPSSRVFLKGWLNRDGALRKECAKGEGAWKTLKSLLKQSTMELKGNMSLLG